MVKFKKSGLEAIFGDDFKDALEDIENYPKEKESKKSVTELSINKIELNPYQPRKYFEKEEVEKLAKSIKANGLIQPIIVNEKNGKYTLVAGERRLQAVKHLKENKIKAHLINVKKEKLQVFALLENIQRQDLTTLEEAMAYKSLMNNLSITQDSLSKKIGKSRSHIANTLRILNLPEVIKDYLQKRQLSFGHAKLLAAIKDQAQMIDIAKECFKNNWSVRKLEKYIESLGLAKRKQYKPLVNTKYQYAEKLFRETLGTKVKISNKKISISFSDDDNLNEIIKKLNLLEQE